MNRDPITILIADDDPRVRELLKTCLGDLNAEFVECADGLETVTAHQQHEPDWVLMDLEMPGLDGISATRRITDADPEARVLIVTQFEGPQLRRAAEDAGACGYLLKDNLLSVREFILRKPEPPRIGGTT